MANNYEVVTWMRDIPESAITEADRLILSAFCFETETLHGDVYIFSENGVCDSGDAAERLQDMICDFDEDQIDALKKQSEVFRACCDEDDNPEMEDVAAEILNRLPETEFPFIDIAAGFWCDKARRGEFGGWKVRLWRDGSAYISTNRDDVLVHPNLLDQAHRKWIKSFIRWRFEGCDGLTIDDMINKIVNYAAPLKPHYLGVCEEIERLQDALIECGGENKPTLSDTPTPAECKAALDFVMSATRRDA